jgi:integrase
MAIPIDRLTAMQVRTLRPGRYADGRGLYLLVRQGGGAWWVLRYRRKRDRKWRAREAGVGPARGGNALSLAEARTRAEALWKMHKSGLDPLGERAAAAAKAAAEEQDRKTREVTFAAAAEAYMTAHAARWKNAQHRWQWATTLKSFVYPHFGLLPVVAVDTPHVMAALEPIWWTKPETASRVRGRIETILDYAKVRKWRTGDNPARWRGHLAQLLPPRAKVAPVAHHAALPWREIGDFMAALIEQPGIGAIALRFAILTAARTGEVIGATWGEVDMRERLWVVPAARMKAKRAHRVPLSPPAVEVLAAAERLRMRKDDLAAPVFPGSAGARGLSNTAMLMTLRRMARSDLTTHGFRSTFRDWAAEMTAYPSEVVEMALAHAVGDKVEAAYRRGDLFEKRRRLMEEWAAFCTQVTAPDGGPVRMLRQAAL